MADSHDDFRSPLTAEGFFRELGSIHIHVDAGDSSTVRAILVDQIKELVERKGLRFKFNTIVSAIAGSQREHEDFKQTYESHTPRKGVTEDFVSFATIGFGPLADVTMLVSDTIGEIRERITHLEGIVVEAERVNGVIRNSVWQDLGSLPRTIGTIIDGTLGMERAQSAPIEIHHAIDFAKGSGPRLPSDGPSDARALLQEFERLGIDLGGLFLFEKAKSWSFRTSLFADYDDYEEIALAQHQSLHALIAACGWRATVLTTTEQILGIWRSGNSNNRRDPNVVTVPRLAAWERKCSEGDEFWVITSDFLGDIDPDVRGAMQDNLREKVRYAYFLHSYADVRRLRALVDELVGTHQLGATAAEELVSIVLLAHKPGLGVCLEPLLQWDYFIANPQDEKRRSGYRLHRFGRSGNIENGEVLDLRSLRKLVRKLSPLLRKRPAIGSLAPQIADADGTEGAVLFTDLENSTEWLTGLSPREGLALLREYDLLVAREVSRAKGVVLKSMGDGYMCTFRIQGTPQETAARTLRCAARLQLRLALRNGKLTDHATRIPQQRIAVAFGSFQTVERSHGYDIADDEIARCSRILNLCKAGHILSTKRLWELAKREPQWQAQGIGHAHPLELPLKGLPGMEPCIEILWTDVDGRRVKRMEKLGK